MEGEREFQYEETLFSNMGPIKSEPEDDTTFRDIKDIEFIPVATEIKHEFYGNEYVEDCEDPNGDIKTEYEFSSGINNESFSDEYPHSTSEPDVPCIEDRVYKCPLCSHSSKQKHHLKRHMLVHTNASKTRLFKCPTCSFETKYRNNLARHILKHKDISDVTYFECEKCFNKLMHRDPSQVTMYKCEKCPYKTKHKENIGHHMSTHKDVFEIIMHECEICCHETKHKRALSLHMLTHKKASEIVMYTCDICSHQTKDKWDLKRHILIHKSPAEVTVYKCDLCSYETKHKGYLKSHVMVHRNLPEATFKCGVCPYITEHKRDYELHIAMHDRCPKIDGNRSGDCSFQVECGKELEENSNNHKKPGRVEVFKCDECKYETKRKFNLKRHLWTHRM